MSFVGELSADSVHSKVKNTLQDVLHRSKPALIEAPPASGKTTASYHIVNWTDTPVSYFASREDLYDQAISWANDERDITAYALPSPQRNCPTFTGENKTAERAKALQLYRKGISGRRIHYMDVYTPCHSEKGNECEYMERLSEIEDDLEDGNIDFLIGNHKHALNSDYVKDRIVVFDEFNPNPFLERFPSGDGVRDDDHPGQMVSYFLKSLSDNDEPFPTDRFEDITDILVHRNDRKSLEEALEWFVDHGVSRGDLKNLDFFQVTSFKEEPTHRLAPLLTLALLSMRKVGGGIELAPPPEEYNLPQVTESWRKATGKVGVRCIRSRDTGQIHVLRPPDLRSAEQVIGLDAFPSISLWNQIFAPHSEFEHHQVIPREEFSNYLGTTLNMEVIQLGQGRYPYAGGRVSPHDGLRFEAIRLTEDRQFALISTKKALEAYDNRKWLRPFVKQTDQYDSEDYGDFAILNYGKVESSNELQKEDLGVVSGSPFPGYQPMKIWAGFCGEAVRIPEEGKEPEFEGIVDEIYRYLNHNRVIQAALRFGRHPEVIERGGSKVYVNTTAIPAWFQPDERLRVEVNGKKIKILECLINSRLRDPKEYEECDDEKSIDHYISYQTISTIRDQTGISWKTIERHLEWFLEAELVSRAEPVRYNTTAYRFEALDEIEEIDSPNHSHWLWNDGRIFFLSLE